MRDLLYNSLFNVHLFDLISCIIIARYLEQNPEQCKRACHYLQLYTASRFLLTGRFTDMEKNALKEIGERYVLLVVLYLLFCICTLYIFFGGRMCVLFIVSNAM